MTPPKKKSKFSKSEITNIRRMLYCGAGTLLPVAVSIGWGKTADNVFSGLTVGVFIGWLVIAVIKFAGSSGSGTLASLIPDSDYIAKYSPDFKKNKGKSAVKYSLNRKFFATTRGHNTQSKNYKAFVEKIEQASVNKKELGLTHSSQKIYTMPDKSVVVISNSNFSGKSITVIANETTEKKAVKPGYIDGDKVTKLHKEGKL